VMPNSVSIPIIRRCMGEDYAPDDGLGR